MQLFKEVEKDNQKCLFQMKSRSGLNYEIMSAKSRNQEFLKSRNPKVFFFRKN